MQLANMHKRPHHEEGNFDSRHLPFTYFFKKTYLALDEPRNKHP